MNTADDMTAREKLESLWQELKSDCMNAVYDEAGQDTDRVGTPFFYVKGDVFEIPDNLHPAIDRLYDRHCA